MASALLQYEPLDVIGNGSFGIIRKVRRKSDGLIFARKELNFERMSERDRKQIVAEVNILKDLHHEHIVRYHDRYVDRDAGILYIVMEYCGGGDLSTVIKQAQRHGRAIPEDTIWNYFMQILLALNHCHNPNGHGRSSSSAGSGSGEENKEKRPQILHRDLKPDNVFLDESNCVKLGDFGLSKALVPATFANTYVGTPYYMSPELMQEKAYDSKSDIWSLGCVIYELCALKPPFHEAKTHSELSILIRNGRIPPLPKGYSPALTSVIKAMLNLNPAMRPSAAQLLQHERLDLAFKVAETQKMLTAVKAHKANVQARERDLVARESAMAEKESHLTSALNQKDNEIASLRSLLATAEATHKTKVREALLAREEELRAIVLRKEAELATRLAKREEEVVAAVNRREEELKQSWAEWEAKYKAEMTKAVDERMAWVHRCTEEIEAERRRLDGVKMELEAKMHQLEMAHSERKVAYEMKAKTPLEEVKNILAPLARLAESTEATPVRPAKSSKGPIFETPMSRSAACHVEPPVSAMKGVILTSTGEALPTPSPAEFAKLFIATPKVNLNFAQIFDFDSDVEDGHGDIGAEEGYETDTRPPSNKSSNEEYKHDDVENTPTQASASHAVRPTRLRRPSIRTSGQRPPLEKAVTVSAVTRAKPRSRQPSPAAIRRIQPGVNGQGVPEYDLSDEENLPSPFLRKTDRDRISRTVSVPASHSTSAIARAPRKSGNTLRALAVTNAANAANGTRSSTGTKSAIVRSQSTANVRLSIAKAQRASEEARKALFRP
ncbi:unnamed protein product [Somion occarium]|uniref:non-specific serine/threonine protein kinase n=1 Tax=Somion occarium TaxID=3059160 RepID=A0ABP1DGT7_9APHY